MDFGTMTLQERHEALHRELEAARAEVEQERKRANRLERERDDLLDVASWYVSLYHDVQNSAPEYFERCGDLNATQYLYSEAQSIIARVRSGLK